MKLRSRQIPDIVIIWIVALPIALITFWHWRYYFHVDTRTYFDAWDVLRSGQLDLFRTPVYPLFLGLAQMIFGRGGFVYPVETGAARLYATPIAIENEAPLYFVVAVQYIVCFISFLYFYKICAKVFRSRRAAFWLTLAYAVTACLSRWEYSLLTESFSASGIIFLTWSFVSYFQPGRRWWSLVGITFWSLFLLYLRPSFLYIMAALACIGVLLFCFRKYRQKAYAVLAVALLTTASMLGYMAIFQQTYGLFTPSAVGVINKYGVEKENGLLLPENTDNAALRVDLLRHPEADGSMMVAADEVYTFGLCEVSALVEKSSPTFAENACLVGARFLDCCADKIINLPDKPMKMLGLRLFWVYVVLLIEGCLLIYYFVRRKTLLWWQALLWLLIAGHAAVILLGAFGEWPRLFWPIIPLFFLLTGDLVVRLRLKGGRFRPEK